MNVKKYDRLILDERVSFNVELIDADGGSCDSDGVVPLRVFVIPPAKSRRRRIRKGGSEKVSVQKSETGQDAGYPNSQIGTRHLFFGHLFFGRHHRVGFPPWAVPPFYRCWGDPDKRPSPGTKLLHNKNSSDPEGGNALSNIQCRIFN